MTREITPSVCSRWSQPPSPRGRLNPLRRSRASSPEGGAFWQLPVSRAKPPPFGGGGFAKQRRRGFSPLAPSRSFPRSAALAQKAALQMPFPSTTPPVKIAFGAARRPRQTRNKNNLSAEDVQSAAEHILNRPTPRGSAFPKRTTARHRGQSCAGRSCVKRRITLSCVGCIGELPG